MRSPISGELPAGKPMIMRTGRDGYVSARAIRDTAGIAAAPAARCRKRLRWESFINPSNQMRNIACQSLRLDASFADQLAPLLGFVGDQLFQVGRRSRKSRATQISEP